MSKIFLKSVLIVLLMASCSNQNTADNEKKAEEIALGHSGVTEEETLFVKTNKERENGRNVIEVEFRTKDSREFEYEIDADSGEIISFSSESH